MSGLEVAIHGKRFDGGQVVLAGLHLSAAPGEFVAVVGPSGAGKSTLLGLIAGLDPAYDGYIHWGGRPLHIRGGPPRRLGMLFQEPRLMPWLSALDNVRLVLPDRTGARDVAAGLLAEVGLGDCLHAWPAQLSGGMQRRVALARAFAVSPRLLLMDEPFVSLDMPTGNRLRSVLLDLWHRTAPLVVLVTHDLREALAMADRVVFLSPPPARIVLEQRVQLPRPRLLEGEPVARLHRDLLRAHPDLLSGLTHDGEDGA